MRARISLLVLVVGAAACVWRQPAPTQPPRALEELLASVSGGIGVPEGQARDLRQTIVYLEPIPPMPLGSAPGDVHVHVRRGRYEPALIIAQRGQRVVWTNLDSIYHGIFSYSSNNSFDLGAFAPRERRAIALSAPGPVRVHCPLHADEGGVAFVVPSPHFARPNARSHYAIRNVPPGRYWLQAWSEGLRAEARDVTLHAGESAHADLVLRSEHGS